MEIVSSIVAKVAEPIVDYTVAPIARQVGYLIFYEDNFKNLKDQAAVLKRAKDTICDEVEAKRKSAHQICDDAQNWLNKADKIIEEVEKVGNDPCHKNAGCCRWPFPDLKSRHQLSRKAKKMAGDVAEVMQGKDNIRRLTFLPDLEVVGSTSAASIEKLGSRKKMKEEIILALKDPNFSRIGVYGLGGVGKTTLVEEIARQVKDHKLFDEVVMVNISQTAELERIQREMADLLGLRFEETSIPGRAFRLRQRLTYGKSILVILDDIWDVLKLEKLGIHLNDQKVCKLLLTSRNQEILRKMKTQKDFLIDVLNEDEAWILFEDMVGDVVKDVSLHDVAIQVAQKCAGLVVLIVTVARALKSKDDIDSWKDALNQLKTIDNEGVNEKIYSALEFSYNHLEGDDVKALFLLCGLLGPQICVDDLLTYGMGLGIFKQIYTLNDIRRQLHRLIGSLKASCLLLENNSNQNVKMHDVVHEVAVSIASRDQHVCKIRMGDELGKWPSEEFFQGCTQIMLDRCYIPKLPERLECPNIKLFCLDNTNESLSVPESFFEGMKNLKALGFSGMHLPSLPQSFHSLIDLRALCLYGCTLGDMTNIGALTNLKILNLNGSSMTTLPKKLGQLTQLKMLNLTDSGIEIFPPNIISNLTKLEELYLGSTSIKWDQGDLIEDNKNASLSELRHLTNLTILEIQIKGAWVLRRDIMFDKLERYKIVIGDFWEWSDNYGASKILKLKLATVIHLEHGVKELINRAEDLYLDEVNGISDVLYHLNGEGFPLLKHIRIQNNGEIQHIINSMERKLSHVFFPKLEALTLQNLNKLENICHGSFAKNSFAKLRYIKVKCCDQLKYLLSMLMVKALCHLDEIEVSDCNSMKEIVFIENSFPNSVTVDDDNEFCSLRSLTLRYLPAIEGFYCGMLTSSTTTKQNLSSHTNVPSSFFNAKVKFSNLETLKLSSIHLRNIWHDDRLFVANSFHKLAKLSVENCNSLKYLFSASMVGLPKLEAVVISNMKRLKKVWHSQFDGLKTMEVNNCEKLENIFPSDMHTTFERMETLKVSDCYSVKEIFQLPANEEDTRQTQVTQLKKLYLLRLPNLKQIWSKDPQGTFRFHNLQDVHVEDCATLEYLFPFSIALDLDHLEQLTLKFCEMDAIVANKEGPMEDEAIFHFDRLYYLQIWSMRQLDRFYSGSHSLMCPSLRILDVLGCAQLKLLGRQSTINQRKNGDDQNSHLYFAQQPLFVIEEVIPKLEELTLNNKDAKLMLIDPQWKDHYLSKLKRLRMSNFDDKLAATFLDSIVQKAPNLKDLIIEHSSLRKDAKSTQFLRFLKFYVLKNVPI
ncbi:probable disease resistance protein At4g27220 [Neltuma alba]|uniref:probable disease resistance protein At4g27220 n=1 Tax=Neltuma alba TaxID=207710 RepID=UPI0010A57A82|nr:probable disease resistance protein At4g27220 [Prosopis alba]